MLKLVRITSTYGTRCDLNTKTWTAVNITLIIGVLTGANESHHLSCSVSDSYQNANSIAIIQAIHRVFNGKYSTFTHVSNLVVYNYSS